MPRPRALLIDLLLLAATALRRSSNAFTAAAVGACDLGELRTRNLLYWDDKEDLQSEAHVSSGLMEWEAAAYDRFLPGTGTIGLIGCGAGRDLIALARLGFTVDGIDGSPKCIELAGRFLENAGCEARLCCGDIASVELPRDRYDAFIFSWFTYCCIPGTETRVSVLERLRRRLTPDGQIIVTLPGDVLLPEGPSRRISAWSARLTRNPTPPGPGDSFVVRSLREGGLLYMHAFERQEIVSEAASAGLQVLHYERFEEHDDKPVVAVLGPR